MKPIIQILYHFVVVLALLDISASSAVVVTPISAVTLDKASECNTVFAHTGNDMTYLKILLPKGHKFQKKNIDDISNSNDQSLSNEAFYQLIKKEVFAEKNKAFFEQVISNYPELLKFTYRGQRTLLHLAVISKNLEAVKFLAEFEELLNQVDYTGASPLLLALSTSSFNIF